MQEQLLGHLLGALDDAEEELVAARLKSDPELRRELPRVRGRLDLLGASRCDFVPPPGLAARTCRLVASEAKSPAAAGTGRRPMSPATAPPSWSGRIRWLDVAVAAGIFAAASLLIFPVIQSSRVDARVIACQDNLQEIGRAMTDYSEKHQGYFPRIPAPGKLAVAGIYAPILVRDGFLTDTRRFFCPGSSLAGRKRSRIPSFDELQTASQGKLKELLRYAGGTYGYHLGHMRNGVYRGTKNLRRPCFALVADTPSTDLPNRQSANHSGRGQNVLREDGGVKFVTFPMLYSQSDDFFANDHGVVAAGIHYNDSVIGASADSPIVFVVNQ